MTPSIENVTTKKSQFYKYFWGLGDEIWTEMPLDEILLDLIFSLIHVLNERISAGKYGLNQA